MEGPRSIIAKLLQVEKVISDRYLSPEAEIIVNSLQESIAIIQSDCMQKPCDCFGNEILPDHLRYIRRNDASKAVHTAKGIGLHPEIGEWSYIMENGKFEPCRNCYDPDNTISIIASEIADSMEDEDTINAQELAKRIFAKFPC